MLIFFSFADFVKNNAAAVSQKNSTTSRKSSTSSGGAKANSAAAATANSAQIVNGGEWILELLNMIECWKIALFATDIKVSFFVYCAKMQLITLQNFNTQTCFSQFLWFFSLKCWFKGQWMPNSYKLMSFDRNINGNRDVKFLECDYLLVQRCFKLTLAPVLYFSGPV